MLNVNGKDYDDDVKRDYGLIYQSHWQNMQRENELINFRTSWAIFLTAGFLTAESFLGGRVLTDSSITSPTALKALACILMSGLSFVGAFFCWKSKTGVNAALSQIDKLRKSYEGYYLDGKSLFEDHLLLPHPFGDKDDHEHGHSAARIFPSMMFGVWLTFGVVQACGSVIFMVIIVLDYVAVGRR